MDEQPAEVVVGRIVGAFGIRGEVKIAAADRDVFQRGMRVSLHPRSQDSPSDKNVTPATRCAIVESARFHKNVVVARLRGVDSPGEAASLRGAAVTLERAALPELEPATFRQIDLIGMQVMDERLGRLGAVLEVLRYPECQMLVVGDTRMLVPMLSAYNMTVDENSREIRTCLPEGFEDLR